MPEDPRVKVLATAVGRFLGAKTPSDRHYILARTAIIALDAYDATHPDQVPWLEWAAYEEAPPIYGEVQWGDSLYKVVRPDA